MGEATILSIVLENNSEVEITLENASQYSFQQSLETVVLPPRSQKTIFVKTLKKLPRIEIPFLVKSAVIGVKKHPTWKLITTVTE
jgi:Ig-like domain